MGPPNNRINSLLAQLAPLSFPFGRKCEDRFSVIDPEPLVEDFLTVAELARLRINRNQIGPLEIQKTP